MPYDTLVLDTGVTHIYVDHDDEWVQFAPIQQPRQRIHHRQARDGGFRALFEAGRAVRKQLVAKCGFQNVDTFRRVFAKHVGVTPAEYRKRYMPISGWLAA